MTEMGIGLALILAGLGVLYGVFAVIFAVKKEKACGLIGGFSFLTPDQQAQYDQRAMAKDHQRLFTIWTVGAFVFAALCPWLHWWAFGTAFALFLFSIFRNFHLDYDKAYAKYKK